MPVKQQTIRGKVFKISTEQIYGYCDENDREIHIRPDQVSSEMVDTILHEVLHAALPNLSEAEVTETAAAQTRLLLRLGSWKKKKSAFQGETKGD